ncbi:hypothetical protein STRIC_0367 [Streptococcus ictaluri 707-05]|uniref:N-acetyltransferase domain-containing protein n=1 Tax=Streptococcus ictaluri 707-05 TaxID=764299 RepID=G5K190_9STRE|nr:hypothetical protein STRIC_0367 [Streptococcus ictaluri 707-05]
MTIRIRVATEADAKALREIYKPYVTQTAITFDYEVPSLEAFRQRMLSVMTFYPYLVAEENETILGYAYASQFHEGPAYAWSAELAIYLAPLARGRGIGRKLYQ